MTTTIVHKIRLVDDKICLACPQCFENECRAFSMPESKAEWAQRRGNQTMLCYVSIELQGSAVAVTTEPPVQPTSEYDKVKRQLNYTTGRQPLTCPSCNKSATAVISKIKKSYGRKSYRSVKTICRHCGTSYTFCW